MATRKKDKCLTPDCRRYQQFQEALAKSGLTALQFFIRAAENALPRVNRNDAINAHGNFALGLENRRIPPFPSYVGDEINSELGLPLRRGCKRKGNHQWKRQPVGRRHQKQQSRTKQAPAAHPAYA